MPVAATRFSARIFSIAAYSPEQNKDLQIARKLITVFLVIGVVTRLYHFLDNRSLWLDEIYLATSIVRMNFIELTSPLLDYQQKAPLGYLWALKLSTMLFGNNEMGLRFFPLVSGIASLFLFIPVCKFFVGERWTWLGLAILALAPHLIYHSVEAKQYSTECAATIAALYLYVRFEAKEGWRPNLQWAALGALLVWFSYSVIFILTAIAITLLARSVYRKEVKAFLQRSVTGGVWLVSFGLSFLLFTNTGVDSTWLLHWFGLRNAFIPFPPSSLSDLAIPLQVAGSRVLGYPLGLVWEMDFSNRFLQAIAERPIISILCILAATVFLLLKNRSTLMLLILPFLLALAASAIKMYPLYERLTVFLAPLLILLIAIGARTLVNISPTKLGVKYWLPLLVLAPIIFESGRQMLNTERFSIHKKAHYKELFALLNREWKPGQEVYLYWNMKAPFRLYHSMKNYRYQPIEGSDLRNSSTSTENYLQKLCADFKPHEGKSVWVCFSKFHVIEIGDFDMRPDWYFRESSGGRGLEQYLDQHYKKIRSLETRDLKLLLYDLSQKE